MPRLCVRRSYVKSWYRDPLNFVSTRTRNMVMVMMMGMMGMMMVVVMRMMGMMMVVMVMRCMHTTRSSLPRSTASDNTSRHTCAQEGMDSPALQQLFSR